MRPLPAQGLAQLFQDQARQAPHQIAVIEGSKQITYGELNRQANRLAHHLHELRVGDGSMVAVSMPRSAELIVALLAIIKAGGAYVPLDPEYPQSRLDFMLADTAAAVVITTTRTTSEFSRAPVHVIHYETVFERLQGLPDTDPVPASHAASPAYVLYTSGSTGQPKGVVIPQRAVVRLVINTNFVQVAPRDRIAHASNTAFDAATFEIWGALLNGAALVIVPRETLLAPAALRREIDSSSITTLFLTTALFNEYASTAPGMFAGLAHLIFGGEVADPKAVRRVLDASPPARLINAYGPTETTTFALWHEIPVNGAAFDDTRPVPIGRPLANTRVHILDESLQPVPIGREGEIHIEGPGLAEGYLNQPELTAERFISWPDGASGVRLYKTGDLGRWTSQGLVEYLGRTDLQVKVRGYRIEPGEIESTLRRCPGIREGVVLVHEHPPGNRFLHAYVSPDGTAAVDIGAVRRFIAMNLPAYMSPARISVIAQMPVTANGKIDRQALRQSGGDHRAVPNSSGVALSPRGHELLAIWSEVLSLPAEEIGIHSDLIELGGNSLIAVQISNRLAASLGLRLSVREILSLGTIERIEAALATSARRVPSEPDPSQVPGAGVVYPATASQQQVDFFSMLVPGTRAYLTQSMFTFRGRLNTDALRQSIQDVVDRHEHLRTAYRHDTSGRLYGEVSSECPIALPFEDLRHLPASLRESALEARVNTLLDAGIDPAKLPLALWYGFRLDDLEYRVLMIEHHFVHDGWSFRLFLRQWSQCYSARADGQVPALLPATQFRAYAAWQEQWLRSADAALKVSQWLDYLRGCPQTMHLPMARPRQSETTLAGGQLRVHLGRELVARTTAHARQLRLTLFQFMFATFALLIERLTGRSEFLLGTSAANRNTAAWESVLGMLVNVVPVRVRWDRDAPTASSLCAVAQSLQWAVEQAELPFSTIVEALQPRRSPGMLPLVQIHFSSHNALSRNLHFGNLDWEVIEALPNGTSKFDLGVITIPDGEDGGLDLLFEYNSGVLDRPGVEAIATAYLGLLQDERINDQAWSSPVPAAPDPSPAVAPPGNASKVPMRNAIESRLAGLWTEILDGPEPGIDDNFFEIGGHSLQAARLLIRINAEFGVDLSLSAFFAAPDIRSIAQHLQAPVTSPEPAGDRFVNVVRQSSGQGNVICVGGHILPSLALLPGSIGILRADSGPMDPVRFHRSGIGRAVRRFVDEIDRLDLHGPLVVAGFGYGGLVAFALAGHLQRTREAPVFAVLMEPSIPDGRKHAFHDRLLNAARQALKRLSRSWAEPHAGRDPAAVAPTVTSHATADADEEWQHIGPVLRRNISRYRPANRVMQGIHVIAGDCWEDRNLAVFTDQFSPNVIVHRQGPISHQDVIDRAACVAAWRRLIVSLLQDA